MAKGFNDLPESTQAIILAVFALVLAGVVFYLYALPEVTVRNNLHAQWVQLKAENDRNEAFRQEQTEYLSRIKQLTQELATLRSIVPDKSSTDAFVRTVYNDGRSSNVYVRTFVAEPLVKQQLYVEMPFQVHLDGTYYSIVNFFDRLAHEQRIVTVEGLTLGSPGGGGMGTYKLTGGETVGANCRIITYYNQPAQTAPGKTAKRGAAARR